MERIVHLRVLSVGRQSSCGHAGTRRAALPHAVRRPSPGRTVVARPPAVVLGPDIAGAAAAAVGSSTESVSLALSAALALAAPTVFSLARDTSIKTVSPLQAVQLLTSEQRAVVLDVRTAAGSSGAGRDSSPGAHSLTVSVPWLAPAPVAVDAGGHAERVSFRNATFVDDVLFAVDPSAVLVILDDDGTCGDAAAHELAGSCRNKLAVVRGGARAFTATGLPLPLDAAALSSALPLLAASSTAVEPHQEWAAGTGGGMKLSLPAFRPKLVDVLQSGYSAADLRRDVLAGATVGVIALALSMALGIASEATPQAGLLTAISAGFLVSALGGSRVSVTGPTAAFIPVVVGVAHEYGPQGLVTCTAMSGIMLFAMGAAGAGKLIERIPHPVITGFTAGIAVFILSTQVKEFLGLPAADAVPPQFLDKLLFFGQHLGDAHPESLALATGCLLLLKLYPASWAQVVPPQILTVVASTAAVFGLEAAGVHTGISTIASRFGDIPSGIPVPHLEVPSADTVVALLKPAFTIALLGAIESLLCAVVADGMIAEEVDDRSDSAQELMALGLGNLAAASLGGLPATGALARTAANIRSQGRSPVSGMVHAATVLAIMSFASPLASKVPLPALAAVLVMVALNMGEWRNFKTLPGLPAGDASVYLLSFALTVLTDVTMAVEAGLALSVCLYLKRVDEASSADAVLSPTQAAAEGVDCVRLGGVLLFGSTDKLHAAVDAALHSASCRVLLLDCSALMSIDATGLEVVHDAHNRLTKARKGLVLSGLKGQPHAAIAAAGLLERIGPANITHDYDQAQLQAKAISGLSPSSTGV